MQVRCFCFSLGIRNKRSQNVFFMSCAGKVYVVQTPPVTQFSSYHVSKVCFPQCGQNQTFPTSFYFTCPSGNEPIESICKGEAHFFIFGRTSQILARALQLPIGAGGDIRPASLPRGELNSANSWQSHLGWKPKHEVHCEKPSVVFIVLHLL